MKIEKSGIDADWMRRVMERYEGPLLRYAARTLGGDLELGRDVVQETFLRLWRSDRAGLEDHLPEWLFKVCRNRALDVRRKERRMTRLSEQTEQTRPSPALSPAAVALKREAAGRAAEALTTLPVNQQEVLRLKFQNGFTYRQIAGITGHSVTNVGFLIHTGIRSIRKQFKTLGLIGGV
ncbi:MAG: sigma-70 family RNA polymerase sigma factor [Phycisphaerae bacterium]|nr:sigma-70 family RNA polymerase sigma factor [Phycisphaerae bacterium]